MVMLLSSDRLHLWIPVVTVKDLKAGPIIKDENLSWEDFNKAALYTHPVLVCTASTQMEALPRSSQAKGATPLPITAEMQMAPDHRISTELKPRRA
ncbi:hypothetical protein BDR06DRAFT_1009682 [Suillus hirtellus]|nr:hypothetical protein BDR06DRAFT_1009682 [Suillus hirtellus]